MKRNLIIGQLHAILALLVLVLSTTLFFIPILFIGLFKLIPNTKSRIACTKAIDALSKVWCDINNWHINTQKLSKFEIHGVDALDSKKWYLVIANHQSWLDIVVLHYALNRKIPVLKFFIKDQLKWIPFLGFAWWAMGCPFMKRYSKEYLAKNPHKEGKDKKSTLKAIENFKKTPASVMNFIEGTRFTQAKQGLQNSPYTHLLKPKAGGIGFVIGAMAEHFDNLLDVTIVYPHKHHSLWDFLTKRIDTIQIFARELPIPAEFRSQQLTELPELQTQFRSWINEQWTQKDLIISQTRQG